MASKGKSAMTSFHMSRQQHWAYREQENEPPTELHVPVQPEADVKQQNEKGSRSVGSRST